MDFLIALVAVSLAVLVWNYFPIGKLHGRTVRLQEFFNRNTRLHWKLAKTQAKLDEIMPLPPKERLAALLKLEHKHGDVFVVGDDMRRAIVATGLSEAIPYIKWLMGQPIAGERAIASGIRKALQDPATEQDYKVQAIQLLVPCLDNDDDPYGPVSVGELPKLLLDLDPQWGERVLRMPEYLNPAYAHFVDVLKAFNDARLPVPREALDRWMAAYNVAQISWKESHSYVELARALAHHDRPSAEASLRGLMERWRSAVEAEDVSSLGEGHAAVQAADALLEMRGLPHPVEINDRGWDLGLENLLPAEQTVWLVLHYETCWRVGFEQIDVSDCELFPKMIEALPKIGAPVAAARLDFLNKRFWPDGKVPDVVKPLCSLVDREDGVWAALMKEVNEKFPGHEDTDLLVRLYELEHENEFKQVVAKN